MARGDQATEIMAHFGFTAQRVTAAALEPMGRPEDAAREIVEAGQSETTVAPTAPAEGHS